MATATFSPILALLLALSMLVSPAAGVGGSGQVEIDPFVLTIEEVDGDHDASFGLADTVSGKQVVFYTERGDGYYVTGDSIILTMDGKTYALPTAELLNSVNSVVSQLPMPDEQDMMALSLFAQSLLTSISAEAVSFAPRGESFAFSIDLDRLLADIDAAMPQVLTTYGFYLNPTLQKYTNALLGTPITAEQLAQAWPQLGLSSIQTGLTASLTAIPSDDGITLMGSVAQLSFVARISEAGLELRFTGPDGTVYPFDSQDLLAVVGLLAQLPAHITTDAFSISESTVYDEHYYDIITITVKLDTAALARDLNNGLVDILTTYSDTVNALLEKYRSWLALISPDAAQQISAESLANAISSAPLALPAINAELVMVDNTYLPTMELEGFINNVSFSGKMHYDSSVVGSFLITADDRWDAYYLNLTFCCDDYGKGMVTLTSSAPILDLFNSMTFSFNDSYWSPSYALTTDTDVLRMSLNEYGMELKLGLMNFSLLLDDDDMPQLSLTSEDFFADLHVVDEGFMLDSTYFGLDVLENSDAIVINGYYRPDDYDRYDFGLDFHPDASYLGGEYHGYFSGEGTEYSFTLFDNILHVNADGDLYSFIPDYSSESYIVYCNREALATVAFRYTDTAVSLLIYEGHVILPAVLSYTVSTTDSSAMDIVVPDGNGGAETPEPAYIVTLEMAPGAIPLPTGAQVIDVQTLLTMMGNTPVVQPTEFVEYPY
ncbi:MAG: hypothetical protein IKK57_11045 [Clostridia bacterium]|nr:hypothetical protein [Clostridia bacterium]